MQTDRLAAFHTPCSQRDSFVSTSSLIQNKVKFQPPVEYCLFVVVVLKKLPLLNFCLIFFNCKYFCDKDMAWLNRLFLYIFIYKLKIYKTLKQHLVLWVEWEERRGLTLLFFFQKSFRDYTLDLQFHNSCLLVVLVIVVIGRVH